jgi:hypothetical protein
MARRGAISRVTESRALGRREARGNMIAKAAALRTRGESGFLLGLLTRSLTLRCEQRSMFWQRNKSVEADAYVRRIHSIMLFAASLAGKTKPEVVKALRDILGFDIDDVEATEDRIWLDRTMKDVSVSFSLDYPKSSLVSKVQIAGYEDIDNLFVTANCLETAEPKRVNFCVHIMNRSRPTPKLTKVIADKLLHHPDFDLEDFGIDIILLQRGRNKLRSE